MDGPWTEELVQRVIVQPLYGFGRAAALPAVPPIADPEVWVETQKRVLAEIGVDQYFALLAEALRVALHGGDWP